MLDLRFPIGRFTPPAAPLSAAERAPLIDQIASLPAELRAAAAGLSAEQLETPYRDGGWTARQVVHHVPESHMNAFIRFKLALTEDQPTIKPYDEDRWAKLPDVADTPIETSLALVDALHDRWTRLLRLMDDAQWERTFTHPELGVLRLDRTLALYAWHGRHHVAHVTALRERMGW